MRVIPSGQRPQMTDRAAADDGFGGGDDGVGVDAEVADRGRRLVPVWPKCSTPSERTR